ncbi:MAG TPA: ankyrin repeat domain-containing protein [Bryobacteraceae bacterium]|nr:ankyrin repeat domain-containing protein [Bryobacteraceae bacterium]
MRNFRMSAAVLILTALGSAATLPEKQGHSFYNVIRNNDLGELRQLLKTPGSANSPDGRGTTPLMYACALGSSDAVKMLLDSGANVNAANEFGATPLMWCAGDLTKVRYLLDRGAGVNARSKAGRTPLSIAVTYNGSAEIVRLLIAKGADVNAKDASGGTVLEQAATVNNLEAARLLLAKGADPNTTDELGYTALTQAAGSSEHSAEMVKLLLDRGAKVNVVSGETVEIVKNGKIRIGRITPLMMAAVQADYRAVELLINAGAQVNATDIRGLTPLVLAVATDHADPRIVQLLLVKGADPKIKSVDGETALDWARKYRNPEVLQALRLPLEKSAPEPTATASLRTIEAAIQSSAALMQRASANFLQTGGCVSCHAQHMTGMAIDAVHAAGVKADWQLETSQSRVTASLRGALEQTLFQVIDPTAGVDSQQFSLLQTAGAGISPSLPLDSLVFHIAAMQRKEGDWPNYGLARPPLEDGGFSHTTKGIRALRLYMIPARKAEFDDRIARAAVWLERATPRTTEDRTMQLLGIAWAGKAPSQDRIKQLIALQRPSGGWGQTPDLPSDAYATGEVLYALHESGILASDPVYRRGVDFLLRTQQTDGSWHVKTRAASFQPYFESGFPHGHDQWISQSGTAWAAIALSYALPQRATVAAAHTGR